MSPDALNFTLSLDGVIEDRLIPLQPHNSAFELTSPGEISGNPALPKTVVATTANWLHSTSAKPPTRNQLDFMSELTQA